MTCTEIKVGISKEAANRLGVSVTNVALDLPDGFSVRMSKEVMSLTQANKLTADGVMAISIKKTTYQ